MRLLQTQNARRLPNAFTLNAFARSKRGKYAHKVGVTMHAQYRLERCDVTV